MVEPVRKRATYTDIAHLPEGENVEIIDGEIVHAPRSVAAHGRAQMVLAADIGAPFDLGDDPGGWWIVIEPEVELDRHDIYISDLVGWRRSRVSVLPDTRPVRETPDWVCEVTSPSTWRYDRVRKADGYVRGGVPHYWLVDIGSRTLEAWEGRAGAWLRLGAWTEDDTARVPPFDAVELRVGRLFPPLRQPTTNPVDSSP